MIGLLLAGFASAVVPARAGGHPVIGYGSSNAVYSAAIEESFYSGFEFGLAEHLDRDTIADAVTKSIVLDGSPLGAVHAADELLSRKVEVFVGFPGSNDCILAGRMIKPKRIPAIFLNCSHSQLKSLGPDVYSTESSMDVEVTAMVRFLAQQFGRKRGLVIINPKTAASTDQEQYYTRLLADPASGVSAEIVRLNDDAVLDADVLERVKRGDFSYAVLTAYPDSLLALRDQMSAARVSVTLVGSSPWDNPDAMRRFVADLKTPFYFSSTWNRGLPASRSFIDRYTRHFHKEPEVEEAFGYDLGTIVARTVAKAGKPLTGEAFIAAFRRQRCFDGLNAGTLCFPTDGGYAPRSRYFTTVTKAGYKIVYTYKPAP